MTVFNKDSDAIFCFEITQNGTLNLLLHRYTQNTPSHFTVNYFRQQEYAMLTIICKYTNASNQVEIAWEV